MPIIPPPVTEADLDVGGDLTGTVADAQIAPGVVTGAELSIPNVWFVGASDDLHAALAAATAAGGGRVVLGADKTITKPLVLGSNVTLESAHPDVTITKPATVKTLLTVNADSGATTVTVTSSTGFTVGNAIHLSDTSSYEWPSTQALITNVAGNVITIDTPVDGNLQTARAATAYTSFPLVRNVTGAENIHIRGLTFNQNANANDPADDFTIATIHWEEAYYAVVEDCTFVSASGDTYSDQAMGNADDGSVLNLTLNTIRGCRIFDASRHAIHLGTAMDGAFILDNQITNCDGMAVFLCAYATNAVITGNIFNGCGQGVAGGDARDTGNVITDNIFEDCGGPAGYTLQPGASNTVISNRLINCAKGILVSQPDCLLIGNDVNATGGNALLDVTALAHRTTIVGGRLSGGAVGFATGLQVGSCTDVSVSDLVIDGSYVGVYLGGVTNFKATGCRVISVSTGTVWQLAGAASTDVSIDTAGSPLSAITETTAATRLVVNGIGDNGAVDPASSGPWNTATARRYDGTLIRWNDGTEHVSIRRPSGWFEVAGAAAVATLTTSVASKIAATIVDAKGDLIVGTAADTVARLAAGTNGDVLTADSTVTAGVKWAALSAGGDPAMGGDLTGTASNAQIAAAAVGLTELSTDAVGAMCRRAFKAGLYYIGDAGTADAADGFSAQNDEHAVRFDVGVATTFDRIGVLVTTAGTAGGKLRLGIRQDTGSCYPGTLILDAGQVASDSTGAKEATISQLLTPGRYWLTVAVQVGAPSLRTLNPDPFIGGTDGSNALWRSFKQTGVSGALPSPFSTTVTPASFGPRIFMRAA